MGVKDLVMDIAKRRGFIWGPSPNIYHGGVSGFYDWGPLGKLLKNKVENVVRKGFSSFGFWEVECPIIMPRDVWEASGHLEGFSDPVVKCVKCGSVYRVDNLIKERYPNARLDVKDSKRLKKVIEEKKIKCPSCSGGFGEVGHYNLMMKTTIGLDQEAYLRPETATTTYLLFQEYYRFFRTKLPFGVFQIGKAFRNEISPRQGVLRTREFTQAEGQLFVLDEHKEHRFEEIPAIKVPLVAFGKKRKEMDLKEAVKKRIIKKKVFAWILYVAYKMVLDMGFDKDKLRIRQHDPKELAHYAEDAWDIEVKTERFGWFEICGIHDRGNYDLKRHSEFSKAKLSVGKEYPNILEIAFGLERPTYCLLELSLRREKVGKEFRDWLYFPIGMAPIDVAIFPLLKRDGLDKLAKEIFKNLEKEFVCIYDESGSIGRRYRRMDEVGTSLCVTVDHDSLVNNDVTIREIASMKQIRVKIDDLKRVIKGLLNGEIKFENTK
jgi:glycyl-tRNA synthetase